MNNGVKISKKEKKIKQIPNPFESGFSVNKRMNSIFRHNNKIKIKFTNNDNGGYGVCHRKASKNTMQF